MPKDRSTGSVKYRNAGNLQLKALLARTFKSVPRDAHAPGIHLQLPEDTARDNISAQMNLCSDPGQNLNYDSLNSKM